MNIFDGHEDKTTEELAVELGISDLSIVNNAGKETVEVLKNQEGNRLEEHWVSDFDIDILEKDMKVSIGDTIGYIDKISNKHITINYFNGKKFNNSVEFPIKEFLKKFSIYMEKKNKGINMPIGDKFRTNNYSFEDLQIGMTLKLINGDKIKITNIENENIIHTTLGELQKTIMPYSAIKSISLLSVYELDFSNPDKRISLSDIQNMYKAFPEDLISDGTSVYKKTGKIFSNSIAKASKTSIGYDIKFPSSLEGHNKNSFIEIMAIHKDYFAQYQLGRSDINTKLQTTQEISDINNIKKGDKVVSLRESSEEFVIWEITDIGTIQNLFEEGITLSDSNGDKKTIDIKKLKQHYQVVVNSIDTDNPELWTSQCEFKDLQKGMRINLFPQNTGNDIGEIIHISHSNSVISIKKSDGVCTALPFEYIGSEFLVSLDDIRESNKDNFEYIGISQFEIEDDTLWEKMENVYHAKIVEDLRVRKNGKAGKIVEKYDNNVSIQYLDNINGHLNLVRPDTGFDVFKEDLKKGPQRTNKFKLEQIQIGTIVNSESLELHGYIEQIGKKHFVINLVSKTTSVHHNDFLNNFFVDSRSIKENY